MQTLDVFRARIPKDMFGEIIDDVEDALTQYGPLDSHDNEETRSRFISSVSGNKYFSSYKSPTSNSYSTRLSVCSRVQ